MSSTTVTNPSQIQDIVQEIDRLIAEMMTLRNHVSALNPPVQPGRSVQEAEYFGMWAERQDMHGLSSREWLKSLRAQQWTRQ
jgi:hypothetical protein